MQKIKIWAIESNEQGNVSARPVETLGNTETEQQLEELLVHSPDLLMSNLVLIGRQLPTAGGPLDLLGIDEDGWLVVFELKRGTLTRDAVAQVIDYASDLAQMDMDSLSRLIEENSGRGETERIEDFQDWYNENYPQNVNSPPEKPRMVLVGLGVDERTLRMVNYLADSGVDIQLMTFHAFQRGHEMFLARQVESVSPSPSSVEKSGDYTKQSNLENLLAKAKSLGTVTFLEEVVAYLSDKLPTSPWPGKTRYSFSLAERTERGTPSWRVYMAVSLNSSKPGGLTIIFSRRAIDAAGSIMESFTDTFRDTLQYNERHQQLEVYATSENWLSIKAQLEPVLKEMVTGWKSKERPSSESGSSEQELEQ